MSSDGAGDAVRLDRTQTVPLSDIGNYPNLKDVLTWWEQFPTLPSRKDVDPLDLPPNTLQRTILLDVLEAGYRFRLAGTTACREIGWDPTGMMVDQVYAPSSYRVIAEELSACIATRRPSLALRKYRSVEMRQISYVRLLLPLRAVDGDHIDCLLGSSVQIAA